MRGFIAITACIVLSFLLLAVAVLFSKTSLIARYNNVDFNMKKVSYFLAYTCLEQALLKLAINPGYTGNETIAVGGTSQCTILPIDSADSTAVIKAHAQSNKATTNLRLTVNSGTLSTVSLEEVVKF